MKKQIAIFAAAVFALGITTGCESNQEGTNGKNIYVPITLDASQTRTCESGNNFALNLLDATSKNVEGNVVISPISIATNLSMLANGAKGESLNNILKVLDAESLEALNSYYSTMGDILPGMDRDVTLKLANSVWHAENISISPAFRESMEHGFNALVKDFTPGSEKAWETINKWCSNNTEGMITRFLETPPIGNLYLLNATYFNGAWDLFEDQNTRKTDFQNADGTKSSVMMMSSNRNIKVRCYHDQICSAVDLPYGNGAFMLTVILPDNAENIQGTIDPSHIGSLLSSYDIKKLLIMLPRFNVGFKKTINDELASLGFDLSDGNNDFSGIAAINSNFELMHQTIISVDEKGTTAAAVSGLQDPTSVLVENGVFRVDRPFAFLIREKSTNAIIFAGLIRNL